MAPTYLYWACLPHQPRDGTNLKDFVKDSKDSKEFRKWETKKLSPTTKDAKVDTVEAYFSQELETDCKLIGLPAVGEADPIPGINFAKEILDLLKGVVEETVEVKEEQDEGAKKDETKADETKKDEPDAGEDLEAAKKKEEPKEPPKRKKKLGSGFPVSARA